jgi:hypothetical protein
MAGQRGGSREFHPAIVLEGSAPIGKALGPFEDLRWAPPPVDEQSCQPIDAHGAHEQACGCR